VRWYTAQTQVRFVMESQAALLKQYGTKDRDRFKFADHEDDVFKHQLATAKNLEKDKKLEEKASEEMAEIYNRNEAQIKKAMKELEKDPHSFKSFWNTFKRNVSARTVDVIAEPERNFYSTELELRAIDSIKGKMPLDDYSALKSSLTVLRDNYKSEYKDAMKNYKGLQETLVSFAGSHADIVPYGSYRNIFNTWAPLRKMLGLDSKFVYSSVGQFYNTAESSTMRDPRTATGTVYGLGFDSAAYVGYQTGQNVYERPWFWATQSGWEAQMIPLMNLNRAAHMFFNNFIRSF